MARSHFCQQSIRRKTLILELDNFFGRQRVVEVPRNFFQTDCSTCFNAQWNNFAACCSILQMTQQLSHEWALLDLLRNEFRLLLI